MMRGDGEEARGFVLIPSKVDKPDSTVKNLRHQDKSLKLMDKMKEVS
jgi:hypothetical protein